MTSKNDREVNIKKGFFPWIRESLFGSPESTNGRDLNRWLAGLDEGEAEELEEQFKKGLWDENMQQVGPPFRSLPQDFERLMRTAARNPWSYSAVQAIGFEAAAVPWFIEMKQGGKWIEAPEDDKWVVLMKEPSPFMNYAQFASLTFQYLEFAGNAYWQKSKRVFADIGRERLPGAPYSLVPWPPHQTKIIADPDHYITGYRFLGGHGTEGDLVKPKDIVHFKYWHPLYTVYGYPPAAAALQASEMLFFTQRWNRDFFANGADPDIIIKVEGTVMEAQEERILRRYRRRLGPGKWRTPFIIEEGESIEKVGDTHREMQFSELRKAAREEVLAPHGSPPVIAGVSENMTYGQLREQRAFFAIYTMLPRLKLYEHTINRQIMPQDRRFILDTDETLALVKEFKDRSSSDVAEVNAGIRTINEVRENRGLNEVPWGGKWNRNPALVPTDEAAEPPQRVLKTEIPELPIPIQAGDHFYKHVASIELWKQETITVGQASMRKVVSEYMEKLLRRVKQKLRDEVFGRTKGIKKALKDDLGDVLVDLSQEGEAYLTTVGPEMRKIMSKNGRMIAQTAGLDIKFNLRDPEVERFLRLAGGRYVTKVTERQKGRIGAAVGQVVRGGGTLAEAEELLEKIILDPAQIKRIARTETITFGNKGRVEAYKQAGPAVVPGKMWASVLIGSTRDGTLGEDHRVMHGKVVKVTARFQVPSRIGVDEMDSPGDPSAHPSNVVYCLCSSEPMFPDEIQALKEDPAYAEQLVGGFGV